MKPLNQYPETSLAERGTHKSQQFFDLLFADGKTTEIESRVLLFLKGNGFRNTNFPLVTGSYSRTILSKRKNGFEAMVARWAPQAMTTVHGHPDYIFYYLLAGRLGVENFTLEKGKPVCIGTRELSPGEHFYQKGVSGTFDNAIHRITVLEDSLSLHVYSDDALKGLCFEEYSDMSPFLQQMGHSCPTAPAL